MRIQIPLHKLFLLDYTRMNRFRANSILYIACILHWYDNIIVMMFDIYNVRKLRGNIISSFFRVHVVKYFITEQCCPVYLPQQSNANMT